MREPGREEHSHHTPDGGHRPTGLQAVVATLRSVPERLKRPESLLMVLAIMASLGAHMPPYLGLGALADYFTEQEKKKPKETLPPVSFDILDDKTAEPTPPVVEPPEPPPEKVAKQKPEKKKPKPEPEKAKEEPKKPVVELTPEQKMVTPPEPPKEARKQSITQKSEDPDVEPPPDAKYLAEESQRVEEESVASVTSETKNDPTPNEAAPQAPGEEKSGDSRDDERGAEKGLKQEQEQRAASRQQREEALPRPPSRAQPQQQAPSAQAPARPTPTTPAPSMPRAEAPAETVIRDPLGSFVLAPSNPNAARPTTPQQPSGAPGRQPNIKVSWSAFEQTFGAEQLAQDRMPREAKRRGAGREKRWEEFRAAIENYVVGVKPGNQTKLNAAADPFAAYLAAFHRNLHIEFAHDFLSSLPASGELANPDLVTTVEIVINADGSLDRVGVVRPSGSLMYDFGAFNAVQRGAPYPPTPEKIRSPDGRVYIKWALHHNESQCGTWNAEAFILKNPPRSPNDPKRDNVSPFRPGAGDTEQGSNEPKRGPPGKAPAIEPGSTLGSLPRRPAARG